jgi:hypothetical protein
MHIRPVVALLLAHASVVAAGGDEDQIRFEKLEKLLDAGVTIAKKRCAKPYRVKTEAVRNIHDPDVTDTRRTFECPGARISIYRAHYTKPPTEIADSVILTDPKRALPFSVKIGTSRGTLEALFGTPTKDEVNVIHYHVAMGPGDDVVSFELRNGRVRRVLWTFHIE